MSRERILIGLGVLILISPWSGLPLTWLMWILPVLGLAVIVIGFTLLTRNKEVLPANQDTSVPPSIDPPSRSSHIAFS
ncbi:MAG: hypothetical protein JWL75_772 [Parcubacteria group bacterium]|nr:hypothetical protein [Parcubacteria group bacterium]